MPLKPHNPPSDEFVQRANDEAWLQMLKDIGEAPPEMDVDGFRRLYLKDEDIEFYKHREKYIDSSGNVFITTAHSD